MIPITIATLDYQKNSAMQHSILELIDDAYCTKTVPLQVQYSSTVVHRKSTSPQSGPRIKSQELEDACWPNHNQTQRAFFFFEQEIFHYSLALGKSYPERVQSLKHRSYTYMSPSLKYTNSQLGYQQPYYMIQNIQRQNNVQNWDIISSCICLNKHPLGLRSSSVDMSALPTIAASVFSTILVIPNSAAH